MCRKHSIFGFVPGSVFVTPAFHLPCNYIIHAVTMRYPGTFSTLKIVKLLLPKILQKAKELGLNSIAIPLLGAGTGHIDEEKILELYRHVFEPVDFVDIYVYVYRK